MKDDRLAGKVAIVTGSGKGVGAGIVRILTSHGVKCCINCNTNPTMAEELLKEITEEGGEAFICQADVTNDEQRIFMIEETVRRYGHLDVLVNNAAMQPNKYVDQYDYETFKRIWNINIGGYYRMVRDCLPYLKESEMPRIVNVSSIHGKRPTNFDAGYAMTKGAIRMFTREMSVDLAQYGIRVNAIDLGGCRIEFKTGNPPENGHRPIVTRNKEMVRKFRYLGPDDVGDLVSFLISEDGNAVNGDGIRLDNGSIFIS